MFYSMFDQGLGLGLEAWLEAWLRNIKTSTFDYYIIFLCIYFYYKSAVKKDFSI